MQTFKQDIQTLYNYTKTRQEELSQFYKTLDDDTAFIDKQLIIDNYLRKCNIEANNASRLAVATRLVTLRDDQLSQLLIKNDFDEAQTRRAKELAYELASAYHLELFTKTFSFINDHNLFTPFYRTYLEGIHEIGLGFTAWQGAWTAHIIDDINKDLYEKYEGDEPAIFAMIQKEGFIDKDADGSLGDRAYSVLVEKDEGYEVQAYALAFAREVKDVSFAIEKMIGRLSGLEDEVYGQKEEIIAYLKALDMALLEDDRHALIGRWADVDRAWMDVTIPFQPGHPLEYYEDKYRKAVALEWDIRLSDPRSRDADKVKDNVKSFYEKLFIQIDASKEAVLKNTLANLDRVQLYIGRPLFYYGANFLGLFSAQVVPNDETVTKEFGKKIYAYADNVLDATRAKPFMKIQREVFGDDFLKSDRDMVFNKPDIWHQVYDITTLGHEFGHILWLDSDTETHMNKNGMFKNIEEFKATAGGLVAFFSNEDEALAKYVFSDTIKRAVGLIAWMKTAEVEAYYCEGLIHLTGLFETGVLHFNQKLEIDMSNEAYERHKVWYKKTYAELGVHYLAKKDAKEFLYRYVQKEGDVYKPTNERVRYFVNYYWNLYQDIGMEIE